MKQVQQGKAQTEEEHKKYDTDCMVCMKLMIEPVKLDCGHLICLSCLEKTLMVKRECPACRKHIPMNFKLKVDTVTQQMCKNSRSEEFKEGYAELKQEIDRRNLYCDMDFVLGNRHEHVPQKVKVGEKWITRNLHKWTLFLKASDPTVDASLTELIEKVKVSLDEDYGATYAWIRPKDDKFELTYTGWAPFVSTVTIYWKRETGMRFEPTSVYHRLSFKGKGQWNEVTLRVLKQAKRLLE